MNSRLLTIILLAVSVTALGGCSNIGNENPVTPEKMEEIRNKTAAERAAGPPPGAANSRPPR